MNLRVWTVQGKTEEAILIATDEYFAKRYAEQMGFFGALVEVKQPTVFLGELAEK